MYVYIYYSNSLVLQVQLHKATEAREKGERRVKQIEEEAKRKDEEILDLKGKVGGKYLANFYFNLVEFVSLQIRCAINKLLHRTQ